MRTSTVSLSVLLVAALAYAGYLQLENSRLKGELAEGRAEVALLDGTDLGNDREPVKEEATQWAGRRTEGPALGAGAKGTSEAGGGEERSSWQDRRRERMERMAAAFEDPQMRVDMIERQMNRIDSRYAEFFKELGLSNEDLDTLRTLMAERGVINWESRMRRFGAESDEERELLEQERKQQRDVLGDEIKALLGDDRAIALKDYTESLPYREEVSRLETSLSFSESPLTDAQSELLVEQLRQATQDFEYTNDLSEMRGRQFGNVSSGDVSLYFEERAKRDDLILQSVAGTLNDSQLAAFAERQLAERERDRRQMEFMLNSGGSFSGNGRPRP